MFLSFAHLLLIEFVRKTNDAFLLIHLFFVPTLFEDSLREGDYQYIYGILLLINLLNVICCIKNFEFLFDILILVSLTISKTFLSTIQYVTRYRTK